MKLLCTWGSIACMLIAVNANCQTAPLLNQHPVEKTALFSQLPDKIVCSKTSLQQIFSASLNGTVTIPLSKELTIEGIVIAKTNIAADQLSINLRCTNYKNALLNISRLTKDDGSYSYIGRIVSPSHGDVLLLWEENGQYTFIRQKQLLAMVE